MGLTVTTDSESGNLEWLFRLRLSGCGDVAQASKPAVSQVSKPAECSLGIVAHESEWRALSLSNGPSDSREIAIIPHRWLCLSSR
jgi:hypothetical protein